MDETKKNLDPEYIEFEVPNKPYTINYNTALNKYKRYPVYVYV